VNSDPAESGLEERGLDQTSLARSAATDQGAEDSDRRPHSRPEIVYRRTAAHRTAAGLSGDAHRTAKCLDEQFVTGPTAHGTDVPESAEIRIDQARETFSELGGIKTEFFGRSGTEVVDEDIGGSDELDQPVILFWILQIQHDALLIAVHLMKQCGVAIPEGRAPLPCVVAARLFHLDYLGPEVA
jgi:hypothetical protein